MLKDRRAQKLSDANRRTGLSLKTAA